MEYQRVFKIKQDGKYRFLKVQDEHVLFTPGKHTLEADGQVYGNVTSVEFIGLVPKSTQLKLVV